MRFSKMPLSRQIMVIMLLSIGVLAATLIGIVLRLSSQSVEDMARDTVGTAAASRTRTLADYAATLQDQAAAFARSEPVKDAVVELVTGWQLAARNGKTDRLRATYVGDNPFPEGERQKLESAPGLTEYYADAHAAAQPLMRDFIGLGRFMDAFVVGTDGMVLYSYRKTVEFGTRLQGADTALGFAAARAEGGFTGLMEDPSAAPGFSADFGFPMTDRNGARLATLVFRVDDRPIVEILNDRTGIGAEGRTLLVFEHGKALSFEGAAARPLTVAAPFLDAADAQRPSGGDLITDDGTPNVGAAMRLSAGARPVTVATIKPLVAVMAAVDHLVRILCLAAAIVAAAVLALGFLLMRRILAPLNRTIGEVQALAGGNYGTAISGQARGDEIGRLAQALQVFKENGLAVRRLERDAAEARERSERQRKEELLALAAGFEASIKHVVDRVTRASSQMTEVAGELRATAEETREQSSAVAAAASQATANVQTVATAAGELAGSIHEIGRQVELSNAVAQEAGQAVERTDRSVQGLVAANQQIEGIVKLIAGIATHTNLLALNATIEAARAGEAGKGFAIVASEVKTLAGQTAKATEDISLQIAAMQGVSAEVVEAVRRIGGVIGRMTEIAATIASAVEEQLAATREIARNVTQAAAGTEQVSGRIDGVRIAAATTELAAGQSFASAQDIAEQSGHLEEEVARFLQRVRGA